MKKSIITSIAVLALAASCIEDSRNNFMVEDTLSLVFDEQVVPVSVHAGGFDVTVLKAGKGTLAATAILGVSQESLDAYNAENSTSYSAFPASAYSFESNSVSFKAEDLTAHAMIRWDPATAIAALDGKSSVIPVKLEAGSLDINTKRDFILVNILNTTVGFASSGATVSAKENPEEDSEVQFKISLDVPLPDDLCVTVAADNSLIPAYGASSGISFTQAPAGLISIPSEGYTIPKGQTDAFFSLPVKNSALFDGGAMKNFYAILVPLKITSASREGVVISDQVFYLRVNNPSALSFSRVWGKYSTSKLWTEEYSLPSGSDRNLTTDGNWVYLPCAVAPSAGGTPKITAISVTDPSVTMQVNCEGMVESTITSACVRVVDKGDGKLMLTASGAESDNFSFYAWEDGLDKAPTVTPLQCTWRRSGDRYELHGTWADGMLYCHSYQGTFSTRYKVSGGKFEKTDRTLVNAPYTGFGGHYKHPDSEEMLFASSDTAAFVTMTGGTYKAGDGQDVYDMTATPYVGGQMSFGYRCFSYKGEKYIAYTAAELEDGVLEDGLTPGPSMKRARLVIVKDKGGFKASLDGDNKEIIYEAPIQGESFDDIAIAESAVSQGDCSVCVLSDKVIIAAGFQGLGVSVFKLE